MKTLPPVYKGMTYVYVMSWRKIWDNVDVRRVTQSLHCGDADV